MAFYRHTLEVTCRMAFPVDMLRYDRCYPTSEQDSGRIAWGTGARTPQGRTVKVETVRRGKGNPWTRERWMSFGCSGVVKGCERI